MLSYSSSQRTLFPVFILLFCPSYSFLSPCRAYSQPYTDILCIQKRKHISNKRDAAELYVCIENVVLHSARKGPSPKDAA